MQENVKNENSFKHMSLLGESGRFYMVQSCSFQNGSLYICSKSYLFVLIYAKGTVRSTEVQLGKVSACILGTNVLIRPCWRHRITKQKKPALPGERKIQIKKD